MKIFAAIYTLCPFPYAGNGITKMILELLNITSELTLIFRDMGQGGDRIYTAT